MGFNADICTPIKLKLDTTERDFHRYNFRVPSAGQKPKKLPLSKCNTDGTAVFEIPDTLKYRIKQS